MTARWTPERVAILRALWDAGRSGQAISNILGGDMTRNAVIGKARRLGLTSRPSPIKHKPPPAPGNFTLLDLTTETCAFPMGPEREPAKLFCGCQVAVQGAPYCPLHMQRTHVAVRQDVSLTNWEGPQRRAFG